MSSPTPREPALSITLVPNVQAAPRRVRYATSALVQSPPGRELTGLRKLLEWLQRSR